MIAAEHKSDFDEPSNEHPNIPRSSANVKKLCGIKAYLANFDLIFI